MASVVSICNLALANVGKPSISSITEATAEARACNQFYEHVRDVMLQSYPWRFATKVEALAEITNARADSWGYAYQKPSDCLKILRVHDAYLSPYLPSDGALTVQGGYVYEVAEETIFTDPTPAYLNYIFRLTDPTKFSPMFVEAFGWELAVRLAMPLTRDPKVRADAWNVAKMTTPQAQVADANDGRDEVQNRSAALEVRDGSPLYDAYGRPIT